MHVEDAGLLYVPSEQILQAENSTLVAELVRYVPAAQSEQDSDAAPLYWPVLQLQRERSDKSGGVSVDFLSRLH